jgi:DNA polymerase-3 subunit epsilon
LYIGPVEDKHAAARLIQLIEDAFDLCRYYNLLVEAPSAKPCAYKEMGRCPAPCDGSISMEQYRHLIDWSARTMVDPADAIRLHKARMQQAAAELRFELAGKIKAYVEQLSQLGKGAYRHARWLKDFQFVSFQHGPKHGTAKVILITPGRIEQVACLTGEPHRAGETLHAVLKAAAEVPAGNVDAIGAERIGIVAHHLFSAKHSHGVFLRLEETDDRAVAKAYRDLQKQSVQEETEGEGVLKELQAL